MNIIESIENELSIVPKMKSMAAVKLGGIMESLYGTCYEKFMRVRMEVKQPVINQAEFPPLNVAAAAAPEHPQNNEIGPEINGQEFMANFEHLNKPGITIGRVIISPNKSKNNYNDVLSLYGSGLIIDYSTWEIIALPPKAVITEIGRNKFKTMTNSPYTIYALEDGTTINLYFYDGRWNLGSTNGYDVSGIKWLSDKTYGELLNEAIMAQFGAPETFFNALDKEYCYSVILQHPEVHPYVENKPKVTLVQMYDRKNKQIAPLITLVEAAEKYKLALQEVQLIKCSPDVPNALFDHLSGSKAPTAARAPAAAASAQQTPQFGYIVRFEDPKLQPDIVFESQLFNKLKHHIYNGVRGCNVKDTTPTEKCIYLALRAVLRGPKNLTEFGRLFPKLSARSHNISVLHSQLHMKLVHAYRSRDPIGYLKKEKADIERQGTQQKEMRGTSKNNLKINTLAQWFINGPLKRVGHLDGSSISAKIINDCITDERIINDYAAMLLA